MPAIGKIYPKPLHETKQSCSVSSMNDDSSSSTKTPRYKESLSRTVIAVSSKNDEVPASVSPTNSVSTSDDKNSRRALILKMAKARMQKHKRESSEPPVSGGKSSSIDTNLPKSNFSLDLD